MADASLFTHGFCQSRSRRCRVEVILCSPSSRSDAWARCGRSDRVGSNLARWTVGQETRQWAKPKETALPIQLAGKLNLCRCSRLTGVQRELGGMRSFDDVLRLRYL